MNSSEWSSRIEWLVLLVLVFAVAEIPAMPTIDVGQFWTICSPVASIRFLSE